MFIAGAQSLEMNKKVVNALNVFPVPDGDTGTNMSLTMQSAVKEIKNNKGDTLEEIASLAANGSLMGARGNSGVILSQLLRGFAKGVKGKEKLTTKDLANALKMASDTAYKAVMKPVEGTILTVARESAEQAIVIAKKEKDIIAFVEKVIIEAEETLKKTPDMLKVLKEAGVVDSGGKGLIYIYLGALAVLTGNTPTTEDLEIIQRTVEHEELVEGNIEFGYCTEFIINVADADIEALKNTIKNYGDSMLVVGNENVVKVHIHTNHPGEVLEHGLKLGCLKDIKIDNMRLQHRHQNFEETEEIRPKSQKKQYGFITVTMGKGLTDIFKDFDVDCVIEGGQTMNPSTEDFVKAIDTVDATTIFILPNNSNIIMAANQAKSISQKDIRVIPTKSVPQGITSLMAFNLENTPQGNEEEMLEAIQNVKTAQVTYAVRDTSYNDIAIHEGDILGIGEGEIRAVGREIFDVSVELLNKVVTEEDEMITIFYGEETEEKVAHQLKERLEGLFSHCDVELYYGGQPLYYYIFSIE
ncbi:dihydroxyacetone kinase [Clostridium formicaceticum]|nr:DAK2 domain-containing protein [Clostridium formicaceticum]AOY78427.1 dihydroxyacetone kinase [Clostridium formicaceticum]